MSCHVNGGSEVHNSFNLTPPRGLSFGPVKRHGPHCHKVDESTIGKYKQDQASMYVCIYIYR